MGESLIPSVVFMTVIAVATVWGSSHQGPKSDPVAELLGELSSVAFQTAEIVYTSLLVSILLPLKLLSMKVRAER